MRSSTAANGQVSASAAVAPVKAKLADAERRDARVDAAVLGADHLRFGADRLDRG